MWVNLSGGTDKEKTYVFSGAEYSFPVQLIADFHSPRSLSILKGAKAAASKKTGRRAEHLLFDR